MNSRFSSGPWGLYMISETTRPPEEAGVPTMKSASRRADHSPFDRVRDLTIPVCVRLTTFPPRAFLRSMTDIWIPRSELPAEKLCNSTAMVFVPS